MPEKTQPQSEYRLFSRFAAPGFCTAFDLPLAPRVVVKSSIDRVCITPQRTDRISLTQKPKAEVLSPRNAIALDTLAGVRGEMARLYRLALNGRIRSDEMTRFIYALKEIRACLEAEILTDVQRRLAVLSRDMDNHNGHRVPRALN